MGQFKIKSKQNYIDLILKVMGKSANVLNQLASAL